MILAFVALEYTTYRHTIHNGLDNLRQQAEEIRGILMSMTRIYHHQFMDSGIELTEKTVGFLPAHALNRISKQFTEWSSTGLSFNNVSNTPRNPLQKADSAEKEAITFFEKNREEEVLFRPFEDQHGEQFYLYARPIWVETYCLNCHGKRNDAPQPIQDLYQTAFNYKAGDLHAILSIKLPTKTVHQQAQEHFLQNLLLHTTGLLAIFLFTIFLVKRYLSNPLTEITEGMQSVIDDAYRHELNGLGGEFRKPAQIFNTMSHKISNQQDELKEMVDSLDHRVKQRTMELDAKIKELTLTRNELIQSEKMASLGRLVAGFAHEINTPIGVANSAASYLEENTQSLQKLVSRDEVSEEELEACIGPMSESAQLVQSNIKRASQLISSFKRTAIDQSNEERHLFNVREAIHDVVSSLHNKFKRTSIKITINCSDTFSTYGNPGELEQLITNLMVNSLIHGFDNGEKAGEITIDAYQEDQQFTLVYHDNGAGMESEQLNHIFEPFFTTNRQFGGSGLGLYICYNLVVSQLKGTIGCESHSGTGTTFNIHFPLKETADENHS